MNVKMRLAGFMRQLVFGATYVLLLVLLAGLVAHHSYRPVWFRRYSTAYLFALIALGLITVLWKPIFGWLCRSTSVSWRGRSVECKAWQKWVIVLVSFMLIGGGAEWRMRRAHPWIRQPDPALIRQFHPYLQNELAPNDARMHVNAEGFRGDPIPRESERDILIFMLGGSTVYSHDVPYEQSHPFLLQTLLREKYPGLRIVVQNAGNEYHTTLHSLIKYATRIRRHRPDLVIMWHGINDLCRSFGPNRFTMPDVTYSDDYRHYLGPIAGMVHYYATPVEVLPPVHSVFLAWVKNALFSDFRAALAARREQKQTRPTSVAQFPSLASFDNNLDCLLNVMKADEVAVVMASEPSMYGAELAGMCETNFWMQKSLCRMGDEYPDTESLARGMRAFNEASRRLAEKHGVPFLDLDALLPKESRFMFDDCHYTAEGNQMVARAVRNFLVENGIVETLLDKRTRTNLAIRVNMQSASQDARNLLDEADQARPLAAQEAHVSIGGQVGSP
jgi:lysophospholipase L1-like esterase